MGIERIIFCDKCGEHLSGGSDSAKNQRVTAVSRGFMVRAYGEDLCTDCADKRKEDRAAKAQEERR